MLQLCFSYLFLYYCLLNKTNTSIEYSLLILLFFRGLTGFRCFSGTRYYVRLVLNSVKDISSFIFIFFYSTLAFGAISSLHNNDFSFENLWIKSYDLNLNVFDANESSLAYLIFFFATIINVFVMLNLLISILGDSFERFQLSALEIDYIEMVDVIREIEILIIWNRFPCVNYENEKGYLIVCDISSDDKLNRAFDWEGRISMIERNTAREIKPIKLDTEEIKTEMKAEVRNNNIEIQNIKAEIKNMKIEMQNMKTEIMAGVEKIASMMLEREKA